MACPNFDNVHVLVFFSVFGKRCCFFCFLCWCRAFYEFDLRLMSLFLVLCSFRGVVVLPFWLGEGPFLFHVARAASCRLQCQDYGILCGGPAPSRRSSPCAAAVMSYLTQTSALNFEQALSGWFGRQSKANLLFGVSPGQTQISR